MERTLEGSGVDERRRAARRVGTSLDWLRSAQIRPGHAVEVVEWSLWGALVDVYCPRVLGQWFDGIRFYAAASSPRRSRRTWAGLR